ncbi:unnamed protein product [Danaus chrysippus]|uniref:(African queen) hypothetical protein n=1 Tax=Danaus chrysippus TaxID=151541 RepID=A0A8J2QGB5_9NEOP|nr:unnamed protein product [Danaus chrysippus]
MYAVEVGARGITAKSLYNLLKDLGLSRTHINAFLERISKAALVGSFQIWLGRERSLDSGGERITRRCPLPAILEKCMRFRAAAAAAPLPARFEAEALNLHLGRKSQALLKLLSLQRDGPGTRTVNPWNA